MRLRYLFGPVTARFADQNLRRQRQSGSCRTFDARGTSDTAIGPTDSWETVCARLPRTWQPDAIVVSLATEAIPPCIWAAPVPVIGLATSWSLLWHYYRQRLRTCDLVLCDSVGAEVLKRQGLDQARAANLYGCERIFLEGSRADGPRDLDIVWISNLPPAARGAQSAWLTRLACLAAKWRVSLHAGVYGKAYRQLLQRARIVFNHSLHGECNFRVIEAANCGALVFQEAGNLEVGALFRDRRECVYYTADNLEPLLEHYLSQETERRTLADAARVRARGYCYEALWEDHVGLIEHEWPTVLDRAQRRPHLSAAEDVLVRSWPTHSGSGLNDTRLVADLQAQLQCQPEAAALHNALGLAVARGGAGARQPVAAAEAVVEHFRRAVANDPGHVVAGLNLAEALAATGQRQAAVDQARHTLVRLEQAAPLDPLVLDAGHFPAGLDTFAVEWERAAWGHAGRPADESRAKQRLLRWRLHTLVAEGTGDLAHFYEAWAAQPDLSAAQAALGRTLTRTGHPREAVRYLRQALANDPLDQETARTLYQSLGASGDPERQQQLATERRLLARAAPALVLREAWFAADPEGPPVTSPPAGQPAVAPVLRVLTPSPGKQVSLSMIVKNEEARLGACLSSVVDLVDEIVIADTGSSDRTKEVAARFGARVYDFPWVDDFGAARNASLQQVTGKWVWWLDADDRLDAVNRERARALFARLGDEKDAYIMKVRSLLNATGSSARVLDQVRLFRNFPQVRWQYRIHEQIMPAVRRMGGDLRWSEVVIDHTGYQDKTPRRGKLERNIRLLRMENQERANDPYTLFNLGWTLLDLGDTAEAILHLRHSLKRSRPTMSFVRKTYALLVQAFRRLGERAEALATSREALAQFPDDAEMLWEQGLLLRAEHDLAGAADCFSRLMRTKPGQYLASLDTGIRTYLARQQLAEILQLQGRGAEAALHWRAALEERPDFTPARLGLAESFRRQGRWAELEEVLRGIGWEGEDAVRTAVLRAHAHLGRKEFAAGRRLLEEAIARAPKALGPRVILTHVLLQEGRDWQAAERALREVLALEPNHAEAKSNLAVLLRQQRACEQVLT
jgi:tetratricopeptide (TPR) repeat protein